MSSRRKRKEPASSSTSLSQKKNRVQAPREEKKEKESKEDDSDAEAEYFMPPLSHPDLEPKRFVLGIPSVVHEDCNSLFPNQKKQRHRFILRARESQPWFRPDEPTFIWITADFDEDEVPHLPYFCRSRYSNGFCCCRPCTAPNTALVKGVWRIKLE